MIRITEAPNIYLRREIIPVDNYKNPKLKYLLEGKSGIVLNISPKEIKAKYKKNDLFRVSAVQKRYERKEKKTYCNYIHIFTTYSEIMKYLDIDLNTLPYFKKTSPKQFENGRYYPIPRGVSKRLKEEAEQRRAEREKAKALKLKSKP